MVVVRTAIRASLFGLMIKIRNINSKWEVAQLPQHVHTQNELLNTEVC